MRSLRFRLGLTYALLIIVTMVVLGVVLVRSEERRYHRALDERLLAEARLAALMVSPLLNQRAGADAVDPVVKRIGEAGDVRTTVIAADGTVLGDSRNDPRALDNHGNRPEVLAAFGDPSAIGRVQRRSDTEARDLSYLAIAVPGPAGQPAGIVRVATPVSGINADLRGIIFTVALAAVTAAVVAGVLAVVIAGAVTRPLERLRQAARAMAGGALEQRVPSVGGAEVKDLAAAFNEMSARLEDTVTTLTEEHSRLEALLASSANALAAVDGDGVIRYVNPAAEALFGNAVGRPFAAAVRNHELNGLLGSALAGGVRTSGALYLDARDAWVQATMNPIAGGGGWDVLMILQDITEIRRAEATRRDFVANVSHELRTPLAGIKAVVETLRDGALQDPAAAEEFLSRVDEEVDRLVQLVEELLQLARIESGAAPMVMNEVLPGDVLAAAVERFQHLAERSGVTLTLDVADDLPSIRADSERLGQAVGNLIHNALKFTPAGGRVVAGACAESAQLRISVSDTGSGIDPADLPRIFERFYVADRARSRRGTGLGLAIVKHVVRAHGGAVDAQSALGRGSTFSITLPLASLAGRPHA